MEIDVQHGVDVTPLDSLVFKGSKSRLLILRCNGKSLNELAVSLDMFAQMEDLKRCVIVAAKNADHQGIMTGINTHRTEVKVSFWETLAADKSGLYYKIDDDDDVFW